MQHRAWLSSAAVAQVTEHTYEYPARVEDLQTAGSLRLNRTVREAYLRVSPTVWCCGNMRTVRFGQVRAHSCADIAAGAARAEPSPGGRRS